MACWRPGVRSPSAPSQSPLKGGFLFPTGTPTSQPNLHVLIHTEMPDSPQVRGAATVFEIGASLREARETRGLSLEDVQKALRFRERYLTALEEERWDQLPGG